MREVGRKFDLVLYDTPAMLQVLEQDFTRLPDRDGYAPQVAVEFGGKVLYSKDRPTFSELEGHVKGKKA